MLIRHTNSRVACVLFVVALVTSCRAKPPSNAREPSALTPVAQEIQRRGYQAKESFIVPPSGWEISTFKLRSKRFFSFRANLPMPNSTDLYCRFSLFEETYESIDDARHRLAHLHVASPDGPAEERDYLSAMRTGFRMGNVTYVLQTDALVFWDEVQRLAKELAKNTPGAELASLNPRIECNPCAVSTPTAHYTRRVKIK